MDDLVIPVLGHAGEVLPKIVEVMGHVICVFRRFGFQLNFMPGKSEAMLFAFGPGSNELRAQLDDQLFGQVRIPSHLGSEVIFRLSINISPLVLFV